MPPDCQTWIMSVVDGPELPVTHQPVPPGLVATPAATSPVTVGGTATGCLPRSKRTTDPSTPTIRYPVGVATMPTAERLAPNHGRPAPRNGASPNENIPPSDATIQ